ncbi:Zeta-carotene desaturase [Hibiscus syriacus]|uniref:Zeta-carotene desaturase n=1 Tax=Hibiscus syriacus TaxID=106335 RepID=A0A6A2YHB7_HIBSY|nr:Zeta-carotene desaturase [Hibiscus syriacus]
MASASLLFAATGFSSAARVKPLRLFVKSSLDNNVSDMSVNAPKGLFPPEPEYYRGPKLKVAIIGAGLAGMSTAVELLDQGHEVDIYESRPFIGGKVGSFVDRRGNHIEMGLHVFFSCYNNLFRLMKKTYDKARNAMALALSPVVRALIGPDGAMRDIRDLDNISFSDWFFSKGEASLLQMLKGSPDIYLSGPIRNYITERGGRFHLRWGCREILYDTSADGETYVTGLSMSKATNKKLVTAEAYVAACDIPGIKRLLPSEWWESEFFNNIYELVGVPVITVQLRYNGWVTELRDLQQARQSRQAIGLDNLLYTPDADFSCFADLALTSPEDYYIEGQGSLLQCVLTPGDPYMPLPNDEIIKRVVKQVLALFPSSQGPGKDPFRPDQKTPVKNFFLAESYTKQDYIDSMEGATLSGRQASAYLCDAGEDLAALRKKLAAVWSQEQIEPSSVTDELSLV